MSALRMVATALLVLVAGVSVAALVTGHLYAVWACAVICAVSLVYRFVRQPGRSDR